MTLYLVRSLEVLYKVLSSITPCCLSTDGEISCFCRNNLFLCSSQEYGTETWYRASYGYKEGYASVLSVWSALKVEIVSLKGCVNGGSVNYSFGQSTLRSSMQAQGDACDC